MFRGFVTFRGLHLIHAAHAVGFHRGDGLAEEDEVEAGEGLDGGMPVEKVVCQICKAIHRKKSKVYVTKRWHVLAVINKNLPFALYKRM